MIKRSLSLLSLLFVLAIADALAQTPPENGRLIAESWDNDARIIAQGRYIIANNTWNQRAALGGGKQRIFLKEVDGKRAFGWQWKWSSSGSVVAYPEVICGSKPWDIPVSGLIPELPYRVGSKRMTADFDISLKASGTYNMAFSLWTVTAIPAATGRIAHEIMIWNVNRGVKPAGSHRGAMKIGDMSYDIYVHEGHGDASGVRGNTWTYFAFVAKKPVLQGPIDVSAFTDYLTDKGYLNKNLYITSLELGNEVVDGTGTVEVKDFNVTIQ